MGDVVTLDVVTRLDVPAERVLQAALDAGLESVVIAGYSAEGNEYFVSSIADGGDVIWMLERFKLALLQGAFDVDGGQSE